MWFFDHFGQLYYMSSIGVNQTEHSFKNWGEMAD